MKLINISYVITSVFLLTGCSSTGTLQPTQLAKAAKINEIHCYNIDIRQVETRLEQYLNKCFSRDTVKKGNIAKGRRVSLSDGSTYQYSAELRENTNDCKTEAKMYGIDEDWKDVLMQSNLAVFEKTYSCP
ncbi:MAG: hypothetical protein DIZ80_03195 [endosymbiont of Galathealinum brachiosum]|uniref:Lipoprotein n=1 Tax=endosymbiont of Galathealinum brachiosum TaxID=2200906 RepID=A0A370DHU5_9GAMM|nr:MAG: hypothetical protein DIZ80_03195 [endosymbiont of Galathealinum brachiosum]